MLSSGFQTKVEQLLEEAREGSNECLGRLLQLYRNYLRVLAMAQFEQRLQMRLSPSDVVQETFFEAHRDFPQFRGRSAGEFLVWLRRILVNNLYSAIEQHLTAEKRDVRREVSMDRLASALEQSNTRLESMLSDPGTSPGDRAERHELQIFLADQLAELPADYRDVILLRHVEGLPFEGIAERMERSCGAVRMLWVRAIKLLRERMDEGESP
jgi:RNA polymerase sigma-70 factor (ECF subfamily)